MKLGMHCSALCGIHTLIAHHVTTPKDHNGEAERRQSLSEMRRSMPTDRRRLGSSGSEHELVNIGAAILFLCHLYIGTYYLSSLI